MTNDGEATVQRVGDLIELIFKPTDRGATTIRLEPAMARLLAERIIRVMAK